MSNSCVRIADWHRDEAVRLIRQQVFVDEQQVPAELEWDAADASATHFLMFMEQQPIGTARLLSDGRIGRVAILAAGRGQGLGRRLMLAVMQHAQEAGMTRLTLSAQTHATNFYQRLGFVVCSDVYLDAGIPHQDMCWDLYSTA